MSVRAEDRPDVRSSETQYFWSLDSSKPALAERVMYVVSWAKCMKTTSKLLGTLERRHGYKNSLLHQAKHHELKLNPNLEPEPEPEPDPDLEADPEAESEVVPEHNQPNKIRRTI
ncbi:predicted protein [Histoplasma capsulatum var. duboisii H88]|uniref:Predicted protein n=1 Tax=Ajellomyces capsulatus (strain H88) TaxID=544711 RepID=F0U7T2_AJEC8|nr:predicted protein [Histoplasma capsulatum var. duboisii H88]